MDWNSNPHVKRAVFRLPYKGLYFTSLKTGNRVYFHITILVNRSVQLVARNHGCPKALNNVPCVIWSCIKMYSTHEIVNYASRLIIRATRCICYAQNRKLRIEVNNYSCNKLHATRKDSIRIAYVFYNQTLVGYNKKQANQVD